jgi:branched-subunit amino acid ABC-type transport system permease component
MYRDAVAFAILILALIFRPEGLLGEFKSGEKLKAR